jgi:hypothetical protein
MTGDTRLTRRQPKRRTLWRAARSRDDASSRLQQALPALRDGEPPLEHARRTSDDAVGAEHGFLRNPRVGRPNDWLVAFGDAGRAQFRAKLDAPLGTGRRELVDDRV